MLHETFLLSERYQDATLTTYVSYDPPEMKLPPRPAIVVCPGGGYSMLSDREAEPIVKEFLAAGLNVFLLRYSVKEGAANYAPLIQASLAIKHVRENAEKYHIDPNRVFIVGFSAGGHLAASTGILWNIPEVRDAVGVTDGKAPEGINRPDGMILCYPVITAGEYTHIGSARRVSGQAEPDAEAVRKFSLELHVDATTPRAFIWHTFSDTTVPVKNTLLLANAMVEANVPFECHIFPEGVHGLALCNKDTCEGKDKLIVPHAEVWSELAVKWIRDF